MTIEEIKTEFLSHADETYLAFTQGLSQVVYGVRLPVLRRFSTAVIFRAAK